jgi:hypothetical protein
MPTDPSPEPSDTPAPRPRRRRRILLIVVVVLVACCSGTIVTSLALVKWLRLDPGPAKSATEAFLSDLERDDTGAAYPRLCAAVRARLSADAFAATVHAQPRLRGHQHVEGTVARVNGHATAQITEDLTREGNAQERHTFTLVQEGTAWRLCGDPY